MALGSSLKQGTVFNYPYLWHWQADQGETEGRKPRPTCLALTLQKFGLTHLWLLPITSIEPDPGRRAIAIPEIEARRAGLDPVRRSWIICDEFNYDIAEQSFYYDPSNPPLGRFSESFVEQIIAALRAVLAAKAAQSVKRVE